MSFEKFIKLQSRILGGVSITKYRINFGKTKPPFEYLIIEYDTKKLAIRFSQGVEGTGYKVSSQNGYYYINSRKFANEGLLPLGIYKKVGDMTFLLTKRREVKL